MTCEIIYYSATGTTNSIVMSFSKGLRCKPAFSHIDLLSYESATPSDADLLVFASPVYGGRIPKRIMECFEKKCSEGKKIVGIAVYGNIEFGASLKQFHQLAEAYHCSLMGVGAFVAEHTFSFHDAPIAAGRPDSRDLEQAMKFGLAVQDKIDASDTSYTELPASPFPLIFTKLPETTVRPLVKKPIIVGECNHCGACALICPAKAIDPNSLAIDSSKCIRCFACVKKCPKGARRSELRMKWFRFPFSRIGGKENESVWRV